MLSGVKHYKPSQSFGVKHYKPSQSLGVKSYGGKFPINSLHEPKHHHDIYNHVSNSELVHRIPMGINNTHHTAKRGSQIEKYRKDKSNKFA